MIATDGDGEVLELLGMNTGRNAPSTRVEKLSWGSAGPVAALGLRQEPDFVLAADVVYGGNPEAQDALVESIKALSGGSTLVGIAQLLRRRSEVGLFYEDLSEEFEIRSLPQRLLHPAYHGHGLNSCQIHMLRRKGAKCV